MSWECSSDARVLPHLHPGMQAATGPQSGPQPMAIYRDVLATIAAGDCNGIRLPGAEGNRHDRKALTTGILRNAHAGDDRRACIRHGAWGSVRGHEHAHLDPRFVVAASPAGAGVAIGPVEPFCLARRLISAGT